MVVMLLQHSFLKISDNLENPQSLPGLFFFFANCFFAVLENVNIIKRVTIEDL